MHVPATLFLTGPLVGNLPLVQFSAEAHIAAQVFGRRNSTPLLALAEDASLEVGLRVFGLHVPSIPDVRAGTNITVTPDAQGVVIATAAADDATEILAARSFFPHPTADTFWADDASLQLATQVYQPRPPAVFGGLATRVILTIVTKTDELMVTIPDNRITTASNVFAWPLNELDGLVIHSNAKNGSVDWDILAIDPETNGMLKGKYTIAYTVSAPTFLTPDLLVTGP